MVAVLSGLTLAAVPAADAKVGPRVTIAVYGDSVVEGYTIPRFLADSLVPQLRQTVAQDGGFESGAAGLIPVNPFRWHFNRYTITGKEPPRRDAWALSGTGVGLDGDDGPSDYSALAVSPQATATTRTDASMVGVLFTKFAGSGVFTVSAGSKTFTIDARSPGPPTPAEQWIAVPPDAHTITVHGPSSGTVVLDGVIARAPVTAGRIGVELENLGHAGHHLIEDSAPRVIASVRQQHFDISVFLSAIIWVFEASAGGKRYLDAYMSELRARVGLVRGYGGLCLIADPPPLPLSASLIARVAAIDRRVAREQGCAYTGVLSDLWDPATASATGITLIDSVHPRAPGYRLMARALAPQLVKLVRERLRTRGH